MGFDHHERAHTSIRIEVAGGSPPAVTGETVMIIAATIVMGGLGVLGCVKERL